MESKFFFPSFSFKVILPLPKDCLKSKSCSVYALVHQSPICLLLLPIFRSLMPHLSSCMCRMNSVLYSCTLQSSAQSLIARCDCSLRMGSHLLIKLKVCDWTLQANC